MQGKTLDTPENRGAAASDYADVAAVMMERFADLLDLDRASRVAEAPTGARLGRGRWARALAPCASSVGRAGGNGGVPCSAALRRYPPAMRWLALLLLAAPAQAWEFSPTPICTLAHEGQAGSVVVTYDAAIPEYAISVTLADGAWPDASFFAIAFFGRAPLTITTDRHVRSADGRTLTVRDRGFGNVLAGLEAGGVARAQAGGRTAEVSLDGAAEAVARFRACPAPALS